jgi:hypothetical protein
VNLRSALIISLLMTSVIAAKAQTKESAPQEPPFTQEDSEFDDSQRIEDEILGAEPGQRIPPPPEQKGTVNLNESVPEAGSSVEDELNKMENSVVKESPVQNKPVVAVPRYDDEPRVMRKSARGGVEFIHHPQAAKGLLRIEKDGTYVYKTSESKGFSSTGSFHVGMMDSPRITASNGVTTFKQMYTNGPVPVLGFDFEWKALKFLGPIRAQAGFGLIMATGNGRFVQDTTNIPKEEYTFLAIPLTAGLLYRLQWKDYQAIAPFVTAGGIYYPVVEFRVDGATPNAVGTPVIYGSGGLLLNVGALDNETKFTLNTEYGIKNLWVSLEYRQIQTFSEDLDFSSGLINFGITVDY